MPTTDIAPIQARSRAWYSASVDTFISSSHVSVLGELTAQSSFAVLPTQRDAWVAQIAVLQGALVGQSGTLYLEFAIPRLGRRIDAVLVNTNSVIPIEFKVGAAEFDRSAIEQVWDYGLDLKNFHKGSAAARIVPLLVVTGAPNAPALSIREDTDGICHPVLCTPATLADTLAGLTRTGLPMLVNADTWATAPYQPTPTIIEAARALYARHSVEEIARHDADAVNLRQTSRYVEDVISDAKQRKRKVICFVTGVPGAGKTLVGLNLATQHREANEATHAVFLSGNGPLVAVLREALTRDKVGRLRELGTKVRKGQVGESVKAFIQNIHHFRDDALDHNDAPFEHVVIFDEAQRAWNLKQTASFMQRKKQRPGFGVSEPEFLISCMDRHRDWATIVCLVGGGQEINTGEAGIGEWVSALSRSFAHWDVHVSPKLIDSEYAAGHALDLLDGRPGVSFDEALHLGVSLRSFRAEHVSRFVKALLDGAAGDAQSLAASFASRYPLLVTRDLQRAKDWVRSKARGSERYGLLASSKAQRLKPHAIDIRVNVDPINWFLNDKDDTRSSFYLEDAATEFQVQGLEVDWACVTWDGDLRRTANGWTHHDFRGSRWTNIGIEENKTYLINAYRVLLTRARQGMVIFVPQGDSKDPTRDPAIYQGTYDYLRSLSIPAL
jgi:hypothetical protein